MSTNVTLTMKKPAASTIFYSPSAEYNSYVNSTYVATGKMTTVSNFDPATLTATLAVAFASDADRAAFLNDPIIVAERAKRAEYNQLHGIQEAAI